MDFWSIFPCQICHAYFQIIIFNVKKKWVFFLVFGNVILLVLPRKHLNLCLQLVDANSVSHKITVSLWQGMGLALVTVPMVAGLELFTWSRNASSHIVLFFFYQQLFCGLLSCCCSCFLCLQALIYYLFIYSWLPLINKLVGNPGIITSLKKVGIRSLAP